MIDNKHNQCTPFLDQVSRECSELAQKFKANITSRFSQRTTDKELYLWSHDNLISQDTSMSDNDVLKMAERLRRFVPQILQQHTLTHWKQLKSTYQLNFAMAQLTQSAIHPLVRAIRTIHCTTVETEREFSILHYIKRKERNKLTTEHLAVISRVAHNAPPLIPPDDMEMLLEENKRSTIKPVKRDYPDISDWNL
ncbi:hypothetical protein BLNAU_21559 [Blattamonas nauphoetae]|uniref:HAT C-terminal dimerisation domain-containing protein n=1 Tax=Blattamonas nauphoetae TaxID=2049346 RepID=A0ABQ9WVI9_9EUKA|nr:hypothetical protein BLNAU_21559 [Blattamonas nauphoetae]